MSELKIGDTVIIDKEDRKILGIRTYDEYGSGTNSDNFHIYNTENQEEVYCIKFHDIMNTYSKENIIAIIDKIKYPAASNGVSILQRCRAAGYLTLAAFANWPCKHGRLAHCSRE